MDPVALNGTPLVLHNRFFSPSSPYVKRFAFIVDRNDSSVAVPVDAAFWRALLGPAARWGMHTYEQDRSHSRLLNLTGRYSLACSCRFCTCSLPRNT